MTPQPKPFDPYCRRSAADIPDVVIGAADEEMSPEDFAREDGTYDPDTGLFACMGCYIQLGMPSSPTGWKANATAVALR